MFTEKLLQRPQNTLPSLMQNAVGERSALAGYELARADAVLLQELCVCITQRCAGANKLCLLMLN